MIHIDPNLFPESEDVYIVGGTVRDLILGRTPVDYDIAIRGCPESFAKQVASRLSGHLVTLGKPGKMLSRVISDDHIFDISSIEGATIEHDLKQRDFTINAMAYRLSSGQLIDISGGLGDISEKIIRIVSNKVFRKDPVRLIRAYRLAALLEFTIDPASEAAISQNATLIRDSAGERVREELFKMLGYGNSLFHLLRMDKTGLMSAIFPEMEPLKRCAQNRFHCYDVFAHTLKAYDHLERMLRHPDKFIHSTPGQVGPNYKTDGKTGGKELPPALLKCAMLFHDIGKPLVRSVDKSGSVHFYGHEKAGALLASSITERLKCSNREKTLINLMIRSHMKPIHLFTAWRKRMLSAKASTRFFMKHGAAAPYLFLLAMADFRGKTGCGDKFKENQSLAFTMFAKEMIHYFYSFYQPKKRTPRLITGDDLIADFHLAPSPLFGRILKTVEESRLSNQISTRQEALELVRDMLGSARP